MKYPKKVTAALATSKRHAGCRHHRQAPTTANGTRHGTAQSQTLARPTARLKTMVLSGKANAAVMCPRRLDVSGSPTRAAEPASDMLAMKRYQPNPRIRHSGR